MAESLVLKGTMRAHTDWVTAIATPIDNSDMIVTSSRDKSIIVWRLTKEDKTYGVPVRRLEGHSHFVQDVVLSSDGQFALSGSWDGELRLWDLGTGVTARRFVGHTKDVLSVAFSIDNRQIVSASRDRSIKLWNTLGECVDGLSWTFYETSCPKLEGIVQNHLRKVFKKDIGQAAGLLRLHFHDCFVQGCDGSILLDGSASGPSEKDAPPNLSLRAEAFKIINDIQNLVHKNCGRVVSCADIATLAARDAVFLSGGPNYKVPLGRRDGLTFATKDTTLANLPPPSANTGTLLTSLATKNFDPTDVVALSGAHTIGVSHCTSFTARLYPNQDPNMDKTFADNLKITCPNANTDNITNLDIQTPNVFDNRYYVDLMNRQGLFTSDQDLYTDSRTQGIVKSFAVNQALFFEKFINAMIKMGQLTVLTGTKGEIRENCSVRNSNDLFFPFVAEEVQRWSGF